MPLSPPLKDKDEKAAILGPPKPVTGQKMWAETVLHIIQASLTGQLHSDMKPLGKH